MKYKRTYGELAEFLGTFGFVRHQLPESRLVFTHPDGAMILLPDAADSAMAEVRHLVAARSTLINFGLIDDPDDFDRWRLHVNSEEQQPAKRKRSRPA